MEIHQVVAYDEEGSPSTVLTTTDSAAAEVTRHSYQEAAKAAGLDGEIEVITHVCGSAQRYTAVFEGHATRDTLKRLRPGVHARVLSEDEVPAWLTAGAALSVKETEAGLSVWGADRAAVLEALEAFVAKHTS